jgi:hypothetical protein
MTSPEADIFQAKEAARRERSLQALADNAQWLDEHRDQTVQAGASAPQPGPAHRAPAPEGEADPVATCSSACPADEQGQRAEQAQQ